VVERSVNRFENRLCCLENLDYEPAYCCLFPDAAALTVIIKHHHIIVKFMVHTVMGIEITACWIVTPCSFVQGHYFIWQISTVTTVILPHMWMVS